MKEPLKLVDFGDDGMQYYMFELGNRNAQLGFLFEDMLRLTSIFGRHFVIWNWVFWDRNSWKYICRLLLHCCLLQVDSGLKDDLVLGDPDAPRFVLWNGKLRPVPAKPTDLPFFDLMSIGGKLRAGFGALGLRPPPPVCPL